MGSNELKMINIHKQLWAVKGVGRKVEDSDFLLAYMTHQEQTKEGEATSAFLSRQYTGVEWAKTQQREYIPNEGYKYTNIVLGEELSFDNTPTLGFRIVGSVTRWSTSNKLIQVEDPRGFVVEIPTSNLTTLLKHTTVEKGEVKEECVWGREGNNHILLPVNSEIYEETLEKIQQYNAKISFASLKPGQVVKFSVDDEYEYVYIGRGKAMWEVQTKEATETHRDSYYYKLRFIRNNSDKVVKTKLVKDDKWAYIFKFADEDYSGYEYKYTGKCVVIADTKGIAESKGSEVDKIPSAESIIVDMPWRLQDKEPHSYYGSQPLYLNIKFKEIEWKCL